VRKILTLKSGTDIVGAEPGSNRKKQSLTPFKSTEVDMLFGKGSQKRVISSIWQWNIILSPKPVPGTPMVKKNWPGQNRYHQITGRPPHAVRRNPDQNPGKTRAKPVEGKNRNRQKNRRKKRNQ